jgi:UDP-N-acetylglucosamine 2-epimerase (non-hydrolysing)
MGIATQRYVSSLLSIKQEISFLENIMNKLKLMTIVGTRPEIIKMSEIIKKCDMYFEHILVHTGQNYDYSLNEVFFEELGLRSPDYYLGVVGDNLGQTMGNVLAKSYELMASEKPDAIIVLGDTNSCLSVISAKRLKIPVFHMEAGNRCFDENLPEEVNRRIVDVTSDVNMCYSEHARRYLNAFGVARERTYVVGSPMAEVLSKHLDSIKKSTILATLDLEKNGYILLSAHREENIDNEQNFLSLMNAVNAMAETYQMPIIYSMHPRSKKIIEARQFKFHPLVRSLSPFGFNDYNQLQSSAFCVVSDSGTLPEEASYFKFPAVSIRTSTERPEALDKGVFVIGNIETELVLQAVEMAVGMKLNKDEGLTVPDYADENVSTKVVKIIQGYTGIVNRMVWRK